MTPAYAEDALLASDGVYSEAQVARGLEVYEAHCLSCHAKGMTGGPGSPPLAGRIFMIGWEAKTVGALYDSLKTTMPTGKAGSLTDQEYVDVLAAILAANGFPPDKESGELTADPASLEGILIGPAE